MLDGYLMQKMKTLDEEDGGGDGLKMGQKCQKHLLWEGLLLLL